MSYNSETSLINNVSKYIGYTFYSKISHGTGILHLAKHLEKNYKQKHH